MAIGQVAGHFSLPAHVLRHWESVGLLSPARVEGGRRRYTRDDLFRVARMAALRSALDLLEAGLNCPHEDIVTCPNYRAGLAELVDVQDSV
jgi:DNA-binding transcriptional MerR regulator